MNSRLGRSIGVLSWILVVAVSGTAGSSQKGSETFTASATVKTAGGATASAPVTITVDRMMPENEAKSLLNAFTSGGAEGLRKALVGVAPTGSVRVGSGEPTATRLAMERTTGTGRLLTLVTDKPILFLGAGLPGAKPRQGYDFGVIDLEVDAQGSGTGTLAPAASVTSKGGAFVVQDYGGELIKLTAVRRAK